MGLADVDNASRLRLNEACEQKYMLSDAVMQPLSASITLLAVIYASWTLLQLAKSCRGVGKRPVGSIPFHVCLAQLLYHVTHLHLHANVDMSYTEAQQTYNPLLALHFAHQAGTLGAYYFWDWKKGFMLPIGVVGGTYLATGMIYPTIWVYLIVVAFFRTKLGRCAVLSSLLTFALTSFEVSKCDVQGIRRGASYADAVPFHAFADAGQALSVFIQCHGLVRFAAQGLEKGKSES